MEPLAPRITKSTAPNNIRACFPNDGDLLQRFEASKTQANIWDGERDGLREVVKLIKPGQYIATDKSTVVLEKTETALVMYPNQNGKHQLENCLQCDMPIPVLEPGTRIIAFENPGSVEEFLDYILHLTAQGKPIALDWLKETFIGSGCTVDNFELYSKQGSEKAKIAIIPPTED